MNSSGALLLLTKMAPPRLAARLFTSSTRSKKTFPLVILIAGPASEALSRLKFFTTQFFNCKMALPD